MDNPSPVPKKWKMTDVTNENNELIPIRAVTDWRIWIHYKKLNKATRKDHFPIPFINKMLERLAKNSYFCYLDGYLGFFIQIHIKPSDQERPPSLVHMVQLYIRGIHLGYAMPLPLFNVA